MLALYQVTHGAFLCIIQWRSMPIDLWKLKNTGTRLSFNLWLNTVCSYTFSHPWGVVSNRTAHGGQLQIKASVAKDTDGRISPTYMYWWLGKVEDTGPLSHCAPSKVWSYLEMLVKAMIYCCKYCIQFVSKIFDSWHHFAMSSYNFSQMTH